jgi:hypothetical protein
MASALPVAPDFTGLAQQQAGLNQQQANQQTLANRANQTAPGGMLTWSQGPNGQWTQSVGLDAPTQNLWDTYTWGSKRYADLINTGVGLPELPDSGFGADQKTIDAMRALQAPQLQAAEDARRAQLAAQGITQGSRISDLTERELGNTRSDADMKAILAGTQEYGNVFNRGLQARQALNNERLNNFNALNAAKGGLVPKFSSYASATTAPAADIYGAAGDQYRAQLDALRVAQGNQNAQAAASDARRSTNAGLLGGVVQGLGGLSGIGGLLGGAGNFLSGLFGGNQSAAGGDSLDALLALNDNFSGWEV